MKLQTKLIISGISAILLLAGLGTGGYYGIKNIKGKAEIAEYKKNMRTVLKQIGGHKSYITLEEKILMIKYPDLFFGKKMFERFDNLFKLVKDIKKNEDAVHKKYKGLYDKDHDLRFLEAECRDALADYLEYVKQYMAVAKVYRDIIQKTAKERGK